jgi:hypothetical protein
LKKGGEKKHGTGVIMCDGVNGKESGNKREK